MQKASIRMGKDWWLTLALIKKTDKAEVIVDDILSETMVSRNRLRSRLGEMIGIGLLEKGQGLPSKHGRGLGTYKLTSLALDALDEFNEKVKTEKDAEQFYVASGQRAQIDKSRSSDDVDIRKSRHGESEMRFRSY